MPHQSQILLLRNSLWRRFWVFASGSLRKARWEIRSLKWRISAQTTPQDDHRSGNAKSTFQVILSLTCPDLRFPHFLRGSQKITEADGNEKRTKCTIKCQQAYICKRGRHGGKCNFKMHCYSTGFSVWIDEGVVSDKQRLSGWIQCFIMDAWLINLGNLAVEEAAAVARFIQVKEYRFTSAALSIL